MRLVLFGRQGAGKGTQSTLLADRYAVVHISSGDMLREAAAGGTAIGLEAKRYIDDGLLLPDDVMLKVIDERLAHTDVVDHGFILDGFPRTRVQAESLLDLTPIDVALDIEVPEEVVLERISSRRVCENCGRIYSLEEPPDDPWACDTCGGQVVQRADDTPEAVAKRLRAFATLTEPAMALFAERGLLAMVDGLGAPEEVFARLVEAIDSRVVA